MEIESSEFNSIMEKLQTYAYSFAGSFLRKTDKRPLHFQASNENMRMYLKKWRTMLGDDQQWSCDAVKVSVLSLFGSLSSNECLLVRKLTSLSSLKRKTKVFYALEKNETGDFGLALVSLNDDSEVGDLIDLSKPKYNSLGIVPLEGLGISKYTFAKCPQEWAAAYLDFCLAPIVLMEASNKISEALNKRLVCDPISVLDMAAVAGVELGESQWLETGMSNMLRLSRHFMTQFFIAMEARHLGEDDVKKFLDANTNKVPAFSHDKFNASRLLLAAEGSLKDNHRCQMSAYALRTCTVWDVGFRPETIGLEDETSTVAHLREDLAYVHRNALGIKEVDFEGNKKPFLGPKGTALDVSAETTEEYLESLTVVEACKQHLSALTGATYIQETYKIFCAQNLEAATQEGFANYMSFLSKIRSKYNAVLAEAD